MDGLVITTAPEPQARLAGLKTGAIHVATGAAAWSGSVIDSLS